MTTERNKIKEVKDGQGLHDCVEDKDEATLEREHYQRIVRAFLYYRIHSLRRVNKTRRYYASLPQEDRDLIPRFPNKLDMIKMGINVNYDFIKLILRFTQSMFLNSQIYQMDQASIYVSSNFIFGSENSSSNQFRIGSVPEFDMEKVQSVIKQFIRDWSKEGEEERNICYSPIIKEILRLYPLGEIEPANVNILVPGAGLGRLAYEIAKLGYSCQGNEISLFMLIASNFVLNNCGKEEEYVLYPWVHQYCNNVAYDDQIVSVKIPDTPPSDIPKETSFSMCAGDFLMIYNDSVWDCVATCFFIDTTHSIISYIRRIYEILKPGGYWINIGPLLYHFADIPDEQSLELSYEEVKTVIENIGFTYEREEKGITSGYIQNPKALMTTLYHNIFFIVRKPAEISNLSV